jgi:hypothetical protein
MKQKNSITTNSFIHKVFIYKIIALFVFALLLGAKTLLATSQITPTKQNQKTRLQNDKWNVIVYLAANNTLSEYAFLSIDQMKKVGSNSRVNVLVQLDKPGYQKVKHIKVSPNKIHVEEELSLISGTRESLFECVKWATTKHPAKHTALILWNHGSGPIDPAGWGRNWLARRDEFLIIDPETGLLDIDTDLLRGIAFNETHNVYLNNNDLTVTLEKISRELLNGKKIDIVGMDACFMATVEIGSQIKNSAKYLVASQEVEPGSGWNYQRVLSPFITQNLSPKSFAQVIVESYKQQYQNRFARQTQSAIDMENYELLEHQVNELSLILIKLLESPRENIRREIVNMINKIRTDRQYTTSFAYSQYIDLHHFYKSMLVKINTLPQQLKTNIDIKKLSSVLKTGTNILNQLVINNTAGPKVKNAKGLSIYFPGLHLNKRYSETIFAQKTAWPEFLVAYKKAKVKNKKR